MPDESIPELKFDRLGEINIHKETFPRVSVNHRLGHALERKFEISPT